jgi:hypothetical protein
VYENALRIELQKIGLRAKPQYAIHVFYDGLLLNFGVKPQLKRKIFDNEQKRYGTRIGAV